ncbi:MAG: GNAT family N-acetyltransferase [Pseudomonadota bacterium]
MQAADCHALPAIEIDAAAAFADLPDYAHIASADVPDAEEREYMLQKGPAWLALDSTGEAPIGFLQTDSRSSDIYIQELSVSSQWQGKGVGRTLLDTAQQFARDHGFGAITLTTFRAVPWNAPFYARYGFAMLEEDMPGYLEQHLQNEADNGLARETRCAMRLAIDP